MAKGETITENAVPIENGSAKKKGKMKKKLAIGDYFLGRKLGGGATAMARVGVHRETSEKVALKILWKLKEKPNRVRAVKNELKALKSVKHENIVRFIDVDWEGRYPHKDGNFTDAAVITLELCENGELFDYLMHTGSFSDDVSRSYFHQLIDGLEACHNAGVVHRDLKPDNLLLSKEFLLKIADFGFSVMPENGEMNTCVGTEKYMAPEVVRGLSYTKGCDIWSCGVILFVMNAGYPPYVNPKKSDWWFDKLLKGNFRHFWMAHEQQRKFDDDFKDLINQMLCADESKRIVLADIKKHAWFVKKVLNQKDLVKELQRRKPEVDTAKAEEGMERKNNSVEFAHGMRSMGSGRTLLSSPHTPKLVELDFKTLPTPEKYDPEVKSYTLLNSAKSPAQTLQYILSVLGEMSSSVKYSRDGYSVEGNMNVGVGAIGFGVEVFEGTDNSQAVAEFRRHSGSFHDFRKFYKYLHDNLGKLEPKSTESKKE